MQSELERFRKALMNEFRRLIIEPLGEKARDFLLGSKGHSAAPKLSRDQKLITDLFWGSVEIWDSLDALEEIQLYASRSLPKSFGIPKSRHLFHCIESHLNELYIMQQRVESFSKILQRKFRKSSRDDLAAIDAASKAALAGFSGPIGIRGEHVHRRRFRDPELHWLTGYELLASEDIDEKQRRLLEAVSRRHHKEQRERWGALIRGNNEKVRSALESYFASLFPVLFESGGQVRRPANWPVV